MKLRTALLLLTVAALPGRLALAGDTWLGATVGTVDPDGVNTAIAVSADVRFALGDHIALQPDIGYWKRTEAELGFAVSAGDLSFGIQGLIILPLDRVTFHLGAGVTLHHITGNVELPGLAFSGSLNEVGPDVLAGIELTLSPRLRLFAGARYDWVSLDGNDPDRLNQKKFYAGFRLRL